MKGDYGQFSITGKKKPVHVVSLLIQQGIESAPKDTNGKSLFCRHKCLNKHCIEPTHLEWGNAAQNAQDRIRDDTNGKGETNPMAKISEKQASEIKMSWRAQDQTDYITQNERAKKFGVSKSIIQDIDRGYSWKHLDGPEGKMYTPREKKKNTENTELSDDDYRFLIDKISKKVTITPDISKDPSIKTPCKIWNGRTCRGYGKLSHKYKGYRPHVLVCEYSMGTRTSPDLIIRHLCGNKLCCSDDHLTFGTSSENVIDSMKHGDLVHKLSAHDVYEIRKIADITDKVAIQNVALRFDISINYVKQILKGDVWKSLLDINKN